MKIAFLSFYSGVVARGAETFVHELANGLVELGNDVTVYQLGDGLSGAKYKTAIIEVNLDWKKNSSYVPFINYYGLEVKKFTGRVLKSIDCNADIIFPVNGQWESLLSSFWAKLHGKKVVISGQSGPGSDDRINLYTFPNIFIGLTGFQSRWAKKINPFVKIATIPNGVDLNKFNSAKTNPKNVVLSVGAFTKAKRHELTINAVSKLSNIKLIIAGGGGDEKEEILNYGLKMLGKDRFEIDSVTHDKMPEVYKKASIFAFPTVPWESFGIAIVEAMASGLPVVATDDPIRREIVGNAGILVDPTNTEEYAKALKKALEVNWGDKPRKQAEKFSWDKIAGKYDNLFKELTK